MFYFWEAQCLLAQTEGEALHCHDDNEASLDVLSTFCDEHWFSENIQDLLTV